MEGVSLAAIAPLGVVRLRCSRPFLAKNGSGAIQNIEETAAQE